MHHMPLLGIPTSRAVNNQAPVDPNEECTTAEDVAITPANAASKCVIVTPPATTGTSATTTKPMLEGASDPEGATLTITTYSQNGVAGTATTPGQPLAISVSGASAGTLTVNADGSFT